MKIKLKGTVGDNFTLDVWDVVPTDTLQNLRGRLVDKHSSQLKDYWETIGNEINDPSRYPLEFSVSKDDEFVALPLSMTIQELHSRFGGTTILWDAKPSGGSATFSDDVIQLKQWMETILGMKADCIKRLDNTSFQFSGGFKVAVRTTPVSDTASSADEIMASRVMVVKPSTDYPRSPPIVEMTPKFLGDVCWKKLDGKLDYATWKGQTVWADKVHTKGSAYALQALFLELQDKYLMTFRL